MPVHASSAPSLQPPSVAADDSDIDITGQRILVSSSSFSTSSLNDSFSSVAEGAGAGETAVRRRSSNISFEKHGSVVFAELCSMIEDDDGDSLSDDDSLDGIPTAAEAPEDDPATSDQQEQGCLLVDFGSRSSFRSTNRDRRASDASLRLEDIDEAADAAAGSAAIEAPSSRRGSRRSFSSVAHSSLGSRSARSSRSFNILGRIEDEILERGVRDGKIVVVAAIEDCDRDHDHDHEDQGNPQDEQEASSSSHHHSHNSSLFGRWGSSSVASLRSSGGGGRGRRRISFNRPQQQQQQGHSSSSNNNNNNNNASQALSFSSDTAPPSSFCRASFRDGLRGALRDLAALTSSPGANTAIDNDDDDDREETEEEEEEEDADIARVVLEEVRLRFKSKAPGPLQTPLGGGQGQGGRL
uniref:Uncharacterized protein n=1 Tax=Odontella aurita TaxID=265563 RepID=A0A7S4N5V1_9STRA